MGDLEHFSRQLEEAFTRAMRENARMRRDQEQLDEASLDPRSRARRAAARICDCIALPRMQVVSRRISASTPTQGAMEDLYWVETHGTIHDRKFEILISVQSEDEKLHIYSKATRHEESTLSESRQICYNQLITPVDDWDEEKTANWIEQELLECTKAVVLATGAPKALSA